MTSPNGGAGALGAWWLTGPEWAGDLRARARDAAARAAARAAGGPASRPHRLRQRASSALSRAPEGRRGGRYRLDHRTRGTSVYAQGRYSGHLYVLDVL